VDHFGGARPVARPLSANTYPRNYISRYRPDRWAMRLYATADPFRSHGILEKEFPIGITIFWRQRIMITTLILTDDIDFLNAVRLVNKGGVALCDPSDFRIYSFPQESAIEETFQSAMAVCDKFYIKLSTSTYDEVILRRDGFLTSIQEGTQIFDCSPLDERRLALYAQFFSAKNLVYKQTSLSEVGSPHELERWTSISVRHSKYFNPLAGDASFSCKTDDCGRSFAENRKWKQ
jgi:hypothetical protein